MRAKRLLRLFEARAYRERVLILVTAVVLVFALGMLLLEPLTRAAGEERARALRLQSEIGDFEARILAVQQELGSGPVMRLRRQQERLRGELGELDLRLNEAASRLIDPEQMVEVLEELLASRGRLQLLSLENEPVVALLSEESTPAAARLYRHGFVLRIRGDYLSVVDYVRSLEAQPWPFFWDALRYQVDEHPQAVVELRVHTLSNSAEWVGV
jgi:MSHA biogenesis protein MshJ